MQSVSIIFFLCRERYREKDDFLMAKDRTGTANIIRKQSAEGLRATNWSLTFHVKNTPQLGVAVQFVYQNMH